MTSNRCPVLCVDDNEYVCEAIRRKLDRDEEFCCIGMLPSADRLVETVERTGARLIFLDMNMPGKDPLEAVRELRVRCPGARAIALSGYVQDDMIERALAAGAAGYISKGEEPEVLLWALRRVLAGEVVLSPEVRRYYHTTAAQTYPAAIFGPAASEKKCHAAGLGGAGTPAAAG